LKQVRATVVSNPEKLIRELERDRRIKRIPSPRDILGSWLIWLRASEITSEAKPGQFVLVNCNNQYLPRPFSIYRVKNNDFALFFSVLENGKGTEWLSKCKADDIIDTIGPLGNGFSILPHAHNLLLVSGGAVGIAPLIFLSYYALNKGCSVTLLQGVSGEGKTSGEKNPKQVYPKNLIPEGLNFVPIESSPDGKLYMATDLIPEHIDWADQVFACGPLAMYKDLARRKKELLKGKPCQISLEMRMACGHGVCYGCTIETKQGLKQVCKDGPVFNLDDVENILKDDALCARWLTV
jgi:dihydroorotate dehydrogenase electron transfer subunit